MKTRARNGITKPKQVWTEAEEPSTARKKVTKKRKQPAAAKSVSKSKSPSKKTTQAKKSKVTTAAKGGKTTSKPKATKRKAASATAKGGKPVKKPKTAPKLATEKATTDNTVKETTAVDVASTGKAKAATPAKGKTAKAKAVTAAKPTTPAEAKAATPAKSEAEVSAAASAEPTTTAVAETSNANANPPTGTTAEAEVPAKGKAKAATKAKGKGKAGKAKAGSSSTVQTTAATAEAAVPAKGKAKAATKAKGKAGKAKAGSSSTVQTTAAPSITPVEPEDECYWEPESSGMSESDDAGVCSDDEDQRMITVTNLKATYRLSESDISGLNFVRRRNPHYRGAAPMRLYNVNEVEKIAARKRRRAEMKLRNDRNARKTKIDYVRVCSEEMYKFVYGDFLSVVGKVTAKVTTVRRRIKLYLLLKTTVPKQFRRPSVMLSLENSKQMSKKSVNTKLVRWTILLNYKKQQKFTHLLEIFTEGDSPLLDMLDPDSKRNLSLALPDSPLRNKITSYVPESYQMALESVKKGNFEYYHQAALRRFPCHKEIGINAMIEAYKVKSELSKDERRALLESALAKHGLKIRGDSSLCATFIEGRCCNVLAHVVAIMKITSMLFESYGHSYWSRNHEYLEDKLVTYVFDKGASFSDALDHVMSLQVKDPKVYRGRGRRWFGGFGGHMFGGYDPFDGDHY